uniref:Kinesin motor domain-containing protein n=1 Tax=Glossina pallidipes TaxID=7398 RepID=A0A1A9ZWI3_GLOPL
MQPENYGTTCYNRHAGVILAAYNCSEFAYGQTGTGKTHIIVGKECAESKSTGDDDYDIAIMPRVLRHFFNGLRVLELEFPMWNCIITKFGICYHRIVALKHVNRKEGFGYHRSTGKISVHKYYESACLDYSSPQNFSLHTSKKDIRLENSTYQRNYPKLVGEYQNYKINMDFNPAHSLPTMDNYPGSNIHCPSIQYWHE